MYNYLVMQYRPIVKWRFLKQIIDEGGWIAAVIAVLVVIIIEDILNDGIIFEFIRPVTSRISGLLRKIDHSVQNYPDDETDTHSKENDVKYQ